MPNTVPMLLMYNLDNEKGVRLRMICLKLKIRARPVKPEEYGQPVGALAGAIPPVPSPEPAEGFHGEMLVFVNFSEVLLNRYLAELRAARLPGVALKAVLTPSNMHWTSGTLYEELGKEHEAMRYHRPAHKPQ